MNSHLPEISLWSFQTGPDVCLSALPPREILVGYAGVYGPSPRCAPETPENACRREKGREEVTVLTV